MLSFSLTRKILDRMQTMRKSYDTFALCDYRLADIPYYIIESI